MTSIIWILGALKIRLFSIHFIFLFDFLTTLHTYTHTPFIHAYIQPIQKTFYSTEFGGSQSQRIKEKSKIRRKETISSNYNNSNNKTKKNRENKVIKLFFG